MNLKLYSTKAAIVILSSYGLLTLFTFYDCKRRLDKKNLDNDRIVLALDEVHPQYSKCMNTICNWHSKYGPTATAEFKKQIESKQCYDQDVSNVNNCISITKDFWRDTYWFLNDVETQMIDQSRLDTLTQRYNRFVKTVKPLDLALSGSNTLDEDNNVYKMPIVFRCRLNK